MNINTGFNPYNSNFVNNADLTKMSQSQSLTAAPKDSLKEGEVFEGSVNSIDNGKVVIGLANGQTMTARLDAGVNLTPGQSVFFQVKSNDGSLIQLKPVSLGSLEANPTLLKALDLANIAANDRTINMVNSMMQNSMSVNPESLTAMNRAMINNPGVDVQTLVTMAKYGMEITPENVSMFENYANDKAVLIDNFKVISDMLPELMTSSDVTVEEALNINNQIREIFLPNEPQAAGEITGQNETLVQQTNTGQPENVASSNENPTNVLNDASITNGTVLDKGVTFNQLVNADGILESITNPQGTVNNGPEALKQAETIVPNEQNAGQSIQAQNQLASNEVGVQLLNNFAGEEQINSFNTLLNNLPDFPKDNMQIFSEDGTLKAEAPIKEVFREISDFLNEHPDIPKATLNDIIRSPLYKGLLKNLISDSFTMEPKDVTKPGEIGKLYERVLKQTDALEKLVAAFGNKAAETIKAQTNEIKQNVNFMNSANEMYNFVQIPLKMYNQNTDSMLYVRQNKKSSYEAGEEITAFLHFDMEHLGPTDVFVSLKEANVGCKWNLADEMAMNLIEQNLDILTQRLESKGFTVKSEVTCKEPKASFVEDFLGASPIENNNSSTEGIMHRYSFDMRA
ncbi:flagellar hook-length control protein FliK [Pseudobutyrivibrio sp.]|uniref:flagellar hook-length control protein FliK n=1 Tax=Pseudobutyrivibrio sp. TaxID=2014367 RepID=UPI001D3809B4|nr:flagellar hook-length control protein FliK [Pseudobutyrivibrio sp.]MBE5909552.1 flagellar hook-length control protein FliK [Pseudobutyrivibrio sp.]